MAERTTQNPMSRNFSRSSPIRAISRPETHRAARKPIATKTPYE
jgi:hypothetical protein